MSWLDSKDQSIKKRRVFRDEVKDFILEAILNGDLKPNDRVVETQIAKHLGVSQAPVREALRELEHIGLLHTEPYKGSVVKELTNKELRERATVRAALEVTAMNLALPHITNDVIDNFNCLIEKMVSAAKMGDARETIKYNVEFHRLIIKHSGNEFLLQVWENTNPASWTTITTHLVKEDLIELAERHHEIVEAIKTRNPKIAVEVIRQHIEGLEPDNK